MPDEELKMLVKQNLELTQKIFASLERQRRIRFWTLMFGIAVIVIPLIVMAAMLPWIFKTFSSYYGGFINI